VSRVQESRSDEDALGFVPVVSLLLRFALLLLLLSPAPAAALDPQRHISQYGHTAWRIQDGFFDGANYTMAQTADGYLWLGGASGLVRFDGVRFVPWTPPPGKQLSSPIVQGLLAARDGSLWIGTPRDALSHWTDHDLINYSLPANGVNFPFFEEENGTVWFFRTVNPDQTGPLCQVKGAAMRCYGKADGIPEDRYKTVKRDSAGNFWLGGSTSLTRWRPGSSQTYYPSGLKSNAGQEGVTAFALRPDGSLWVGMNNPGPGLGLQQFSQGVWKPLVVPGFDSSSLSVARMFMDRQNALWVGTIGQGIYRIYGTQVDRFGSSDGLSGDVVYALFEDREGNLWVVTDKGLDCFRDLQIATFSNREGLTSAAVGSVQAMRDGAIWMGGAFGLDILAPGVGQGRIRPLQTGKALKGKQVTSLFEDHAGRHWVGIDNTLNIYENGRFTRITRRDGSPTGMIYSIAEDADNNLWVLSVGPPKLLIRIFDRKAQEEVPTPQIPAASSLVADPRGGVWLGLLNGDLARYQNGRAETFPVEHPPHSRVNQLVLSSDGSVLGGTNYGLLRWSNGKQQTLSARNGLPCDRVNGLLEDSSGAVWLYMQCGLVQIPRTELQRWWAQPNVSLQPTVFDVFNGVQPGGPAFFESISVRSLDGRLWFANGSVVQMIDPAHLARNLIPPDVHVQQVMADHRVYSPQGEDRLPARTRDVEIDYTALSFAVPQRVRFRYKLEGRDTDWEEPGTRRQAFYTDLRPGTYRFHVIACNNDGIWNNDGATVSFKVAAAWYQTNWFRVCVAIAFLLSLWAMYQLRLRQLARQFNIRLEERVGERTRIARELHDTLLQNLHGLMFQFQAARNLFHKRPEEAMQTLDSAITGTEQAITESQNAIEDLRSEPLLQNDLAQALTAMGNDLVRSQDGTGSSPVLRVTVEGERQNLSSAIRVEVYRIAREVLRNAFRYAEAHQIEAEIRYHDQEFRLRIRDDGKGIDPKILEEGRRAGHWGLPGLRERAEKIGARLDFWSRLGTGTEVQLTLPGGVAYETHHSSGFRLFRKASIHDQRP
jgi:signal transduction histidine kinase/ligand-binding sensor domain-containing protein